MLLSSLLVLASLPFSPAPLTVIPVATAAGPATFCDPAAVNSSGNTAVLTATPTTGGAGQRLEVSGGPVLGGNFGFFLVSGGVGQPVTVGSGNLCLATPVARYNPALGAMFNSLGGFDQSGVFQNFAGTSTTGFGFDLPSQLPPLIGGSISSGSTWHFQLWFRDAGGPGVTSNLSNGLSLTF